MTRRGLASTVSHAPFGGGVEERGVGGAPHDERDVGAWGEGGSGGGVSTKGGELGGVARAPGGRQGPHSTMVVLLFQETRQNEKTLILRDRNNEAAANGAPRGGGLVRTDSVGREVRELPGGAAEVHDMHAALSAVNATTGAGGCVG